MCIGKVCVMVVVCLSLSAAAISYALYYHYSQDTSLLLAEPVPADLDVVRRSVENDLAEALKADKGMGCEIPRLDPFAKEFTQFDEVLHKIKCSGRDWVKCYHSKCKLVDDMRKRLKHVKCKIEDILFVTDKKKYNIGPPTFIKGNVHYELVASDHIRVQCIGISIKGKWLVWSGNAVGFRSSVRPRAPPPGRENSYNVLILAFDSTALNSFIRLMPLSWKVLTKELGATVMTGYNVVGDGTLAALSPILTGRTETELPDARRRKSNKRTVDCFPFIFYKLKEDGYRTAYFEDMPGIGTFQWRLNGWNHQPTDHYLRTFLRDAARKWHGDKEKQKYCVGDTPTHKLMMDITKQFMLLGGKRFVLTFIAEITHQRPMIQAADDDTAEFLRSFVKYSEDTLLIVMGDHGPRYGFVRHTFMGKLSERLPLMSLLLPMSLTRERPQALAALKENSDVLTTAHDLHATILDVLGMRQHWNKYKVPGADLYRGLTMLEPIPRNRSCSEAGIESHWCSCVARDNVSTSDPLYRKTGEALLEYINSLVQEANGLCEPRTLSSVDWVLRQRTNRRMLSFGGFNWKIYANSFATEAEKVNEHYQVKITVGPGIGMYEASMTYIVNENRFSIRPTEISRTNAYGHEPDCISATHPHLSKYCFCKNNV